MSTIHKFKKEIIINRKKLVVCQKQNKTKKVRLPFLLPNVFLHVFGLSNKVNKYYYYIALTVFLKFTKI